MAVCIGVLAALVRYATWKAAGHFQHGHSDFGPSWFGAQAMLKGENPYRLIGPGLEFDWPWPAVYPATAFVAAMPFSFFPEVEATLIFVCISFSFLAYSITQDGWFRLPMLLSMGALSSAMSAQWTPLMTASVGLPWLGFFLVAKPTEGLAMTVLGRKPVIHYALYGAAILGITSLVMFPSWPIEWIRQTRHATQMAPPLLRFGGFLILLALLRWRRPEAKFLVVLSLIPAVGSWYSMLPLLWIPKNRNESMVLAMLSCVGWLLQDYIITATNEKDLNAQVGSLIVFFGYLPCVVMLLRRPNATP
jgi:hypothetical protein